MAATAEWIPIYLKCYSGSKAYSHCITSSRASSVAAKSRNSVASSSWLSSWKTVAKWCKLRGKPTEIFLNPNEHTARMKFALSLFNSLLSTAPGIWSIASKCSIKHLLKGSLAWVRKWSRLVSTSFAWIDLSLRVFIRPPLYSWQLWHLNHKSKSEFTFFDLIL